MSFEFRTHDFEMSHGHTPRGYGSWAFFFHPSRKLDDALWVTATYADAKKAARIEARKRNVEEVFVGA
jgi:hypothetical protein